MPGPRDINVEVGAKFGKWTVVSLAAPRHKGHVQVVVRCECGAERNIPRSYLVRTERPSRQCAKCQRRESARYKFGTRRLRVVGEG